MRTNKYQASRWLCLRVRTELGLTQEGMGNLLSVTLRCIQHWEQGRNPPSSSHLLAYLRLASLVVVVDFKKRLDGAHQLSAVA